MRKSETQLRIDDFQSALVAAKKEIEHLSDANAEQKWARQVKQPFTYCEKT